MECVEYVMPDGTPVRGNFIGVGLNGILMQHRPNAVLKIPKMIPTQSLEKGNEENETNQLACQNEIGVYRRVWPHPGLVGTFKHVKQGLLLEYCYNGTLATFISEYEQPESSLLVHWLHELASTILHCHDSKVLIYDLAPRNIMIANAPNEAPKLIDFGQSSMFEPETEEMKSDDGCTIKCDIFNFGCLVYTIITWNVYEFDLARTKFELPKLNDLPELDGIRLEPIVEKCWNGSYTNMREVIEAMKEVGNDE